MTAEVAIANKLAIALAADSVVTITGGRGEKTYNAANKLFTLSKFEPVGILIYGNTNINGIPIEIIIKEFRQKLGQRRYKALSHYAYAFYKYLHDSVPIGPDDEKANYEATAASYCMQLYNEIVDICVGQRISHATAADRSKVLKVIRDVTADFSELVRRSGKSLSMKRVTARGLSSKYPAMVENIVKTVFSQFKLPARVGFDISVAIYAALLSNQLSDRRTGFVVAGYGNDDYFPVIDSFETDGFFADRLKFLSFGESRVETNNASIIYPFAQRDAAELFMEGVDKLYQEYIDDTLRDLLTGLADVTAAHYEIRNKRKIEAARRALLKLSKDFADDLERKRYEVFVRRALDAVQFIDKNELAVLAESLVSLTALRQKVSLDIETVGGPIDVAVISKGDGFVWVKRKHYFSADLNPFYLQKYLSQDTKRTK